MFVMFVPLPDFTLKQPVFFSLLTYSSKDSTHTHTNSGIVLVGKFRPTTATNYHWPWRRRSGELGHSDVLI